MHDDYSDTIAGYAEDNGDTEGWELSDDTIGHIDTTGFDNDMDDYDDIDVFDIMMNDPDYYDTNDMYNTDDTDGADNIDDPDNADDADNTDDSDNKDDPGNTDDAVNTDDSDNTDDPDNTDSSDNTEAVTDETSDDEDGPELYSSIHIANQEYMGSDGILYPCTYDPESGNEDVVGNVPAAMEHWEYQGPTNECAIYSQMFALEELTGEEFDSDELVEIAEQNGWFDNGTSLENMGKLLEYHGIQVEKENGNISEMEDALADGKQLIVALDSGEIWQEDRDAGEVFLEDMLGMPGSDADHAVQVIGIDRSDPENPMVVLNDSGHPGGRGEMVPLDIFEGAWEDSGNFMLIASNDIGGVMV